MAPASVALVDGHPLFLAGVASLFAGNEGFDVVAKGTSAGDAIEISRRQRPDVLIMETTLSGDAFGAIAEISASCGSTKVVVFTASTAIDHAVRALDAGASGYVLKGSSAEELLSAVDAVLRGETFINQNFAAKVIAALRSAALRKIAAQRMRLSVREQQIVQHLLLGRTNREIANNLAISEKTVKHYMTVLMQKLHARNRLEVVIAAQKMDGPQGNYSAGQFGQPATYN